MDVWNIKYSGEFNSSKLTCSYKIDLYQKNYTGTTITPIFFTPEIIQEWQDDDPKTPIRGCTLKFSIIANNPISNIINVPFETFYSNEDDTWKAVLTRKETDEILFVGFLLQDDCQELCVDYTHTYSLTFTDNLGVLKDVSLYQASKALPNLDTFSGITVQSVFGNPHKIYSLDSRWGILNIGDNFTIYATGLAGTYTVINRGYDSIFGWWVYTAEDVPIAYTVFDDIDYNYYTYGLTGYHPLKDIFKMLIYATGIKLTLNIMSKLVPVGGSRDSLIEDIYIDVNTFFKNGEWMNCYDILEQICSRFNACFFQAHGQWYFVRWDELYRYTTATGATYQGNAFDKDMNRSIITKNIISFDFLGGKDMETSTMKSIVRPDLYAKETMNYNQQINLKNQDLQELGALLNSYTSGLTLINEYELLYWIDWDIHPTPSSQRFIRVILDNDITSKTYGQEIERYLVIKGNSYDSRFAIMYEGVQLSEGDTIQWSFDYKTQNSEPGPVTNVFEIDIRDGINSTKYITTDGKWVETFSGIPYGIVYNILSGDNANEWHSVTITSDLLPYDTFVHPFLTAASSNNALYETHYKNLSFTVYNNINGSTKIKGHIHNCEQYISVKKNNDKEIFIDDTPRRSINGSLFLYSLTGWMRNRTIQWTYNDFGDLFDRLGQATTEEALFTSSIPRYKYEGNLIYINILDEMLTPFSVFNLKTADNQFRFVPGKMTINYHANMADVTLHEFIRNSAGITDNQFVEFLLYLTNKTYNFNYLYEK